MKTMTVNDSHCFQGDVMVRRVSALPPGVARDTGREARIVAHSETGHHHIVEGPLDVYRPKADQMVAYVEARASIQLKHLRDFDTHETIALDGGTAESPVYYELRRQEEWTPEGWRRVED